MNVRPLRLLALPVSLLLVLLAVSIATAQSGTGGFEGTVTDSKTGAPIDGATVTAVTNPGGSTLASTTTDSAGTYSISGLPAETQVTLVASHPDYFDGTANRQVIANFTGTAHLTPAPRWGGYQGTVTNNATGDPLPGVDVIAIEMGGTTVIKSTATDDQGAYTLDRIEDNTAITLVVFPGGFEEQRVNRTVIGGFIGTVNFALVPIPPSDFRLSGQVTDARNGSPISGATVTLEDTSGSLAGTAQADSNGRYEVDVEEAGSYAVTFTASGFQKVIRVAVINDQSATLDVQMERSAVITCRVYNAKHGIPISNLPVQLSDTSGSEVAVAVTDERGACSFEGLESKTYRLTTPITQSDFTRQTKTADATTANTVLPVVFNLSFEGEVAQLFGQVIDGGPGINAYLHGAEVWVEGEKTYTDSTGTYWMDVVPGRTYKIQAHYPGYQSASKTVTVAADTAGATVGPHDLTLRPIAVDISFDPTPLNFGAYDVGAVSATFGLSPAPTRATATINLVNKGTPRMTITNLALGSADASHFRINRVRLGRGAPWVAVNGSRLAQQVTLPGLSSMEVEVAFAPALMPASGNRYVATIDAAGSSPADLSATASAEVFAALGEATSRLDLIDMRGIAEPETAVGATVKKGTSIQVTERDVAALTDPELLRRGYVADGVSRLFVRYSVNQPRQGIVRFTMGRAKYEITEYGTLHTLQRAGSPDSTVANVPIVSVGGGNYQATAVLDAPEITPTAREGDLYFEIEACFIPTGETVCKDTQSRRVTLRHAPAVLIHGLWADASSWGDYDAGLKARLLALDTRVATFEYPKGAGPSETMKRGSEHRAKLILTVQGLCIAERSSDYACEKVNFVGHSMGGLVSRALLKDHPELARRLITLGTPHHGSGFANLLSRKHQGEIANCVTDDNKRGFLKVALQALGKPVASAIDDLSVNSDFLRSLNATRQQVRTFAVIGDTGEDLPLLDHLTTRTGCSHEELFKGEHSDQVVSVRSARGNLPIGYTVTLEGVQHVGMGTNEQVIRQVTGLLELPPDDLSPQVSNRDGESTGSGLLSAMLPSEALQALQATLRVDDATPEPGGTILVEVTVDGGNVEVVYLDDGAGTLLEDTSAPYSWEIQLPGGFTGVRELRAVAIAETEVAESEAVTIVVAPEGYESEMTGLVVLGGDQLFLLEGASQRLDVFAELPDGSLVNVSHPLFGTTYGEGVIDGLSVEEGDSPVITVTRDGLVTGEQPGVAEVRVTSNGFEASIFVTVEEITGEISALIEGQQQADATPEPTAAPATPTRVVPTVAPTARATATSAPAMTPTPTEEPEPSGGCGSGSATADMAVLGAVMLGLVAFRHRRRPN